MTVKVATSPAFTALLADLNTMAKAIDVNAERIAAGRAAEGHMQSGDNLTKSEKEKEEESRKKKEKEDADEKERNAHGGEHMKKSFTLTTESGDSIEVQDATDLLKSLSSKLDDTTLTIFQTLEGATHVIKAQGEMLKSMTDKIVAQGELLTAQGATLASQDTLIKSMRDDLSKFGAAPGGRKAVVTVAERTVAPATDTLAKGGMPEGVTVESFFAKASELQGMGKLLGSDIAIAEASLNAGAAIPASIIQRVLGTSAAAR